MAPLQLGITELPDLRALPTPRLLLVLPLYLLIFAIIRRFQQKTNMSSAPGSNAKNLSRAINISDNSGEKIQFHLSIEEGDPTSQKLASNKALPAYTSTDALHQSMQSFDMTGLPLPTAARDMKQHTTTLTEREYAPPNNQSSPSTNPAAPRLQKETLQVFRETGSDSRKNWKRKVLEYR